MALATVWPLAAEILERGDDMEKITVTEQFPLVVLRMLRADLQPHPGYTEEFFEHIDRYPGCVNEIWLTTGTWYYCKSMDDVRRDAQKLLPVAEMCRQRNIRVGIQTCTLGHSPLPKNAVYQGYSFSEESWCVDDHGGKAYCCLCPTSPEVRAFFRETAKIYLETLKPDSFWPDDDMRLSNKGGRNLCFCPRCLARFNQETGSHFTRETLAEMLFGEQPALEIRKKWVDFNGRMLGECCAAYRQAIDEAHPDCLLGLQATNPTHKYNSEDGSQLYRGLAGERNETIAIRSGGGFYTDMFPRAIIHKSLDVGREAARFKANGFRGGVCNEGENHPHVSVVKSPGTLMTEAAMAIAAGAKFSTVYWHSPANRESGGNYDFFMRTLHRHYPFIRAVRDASAETGLAGCALYEGKEYLALPEWLEAADETEQRLMENALPMSLPGAAPEVFALNERTAKSLGREDLKICFAKPVLMEVAAWEVISQKFPDLEFLKKARLETPGKKFGLFANLASEVFEGDYEARDVSKAVRRLSPEVILTSRVYRETDENVGASAIIPTEFGGKIVLVQFLDIWHGWTGYRRECILNALDQAVPGRMAVRLLTSGYAVCIFARTTKDGKAACAFLINVAAGDTPALTIALRRPAHKKYRLQRQMADPLELKVLSRTDDEIILELPPIAPWRAVLLEGVAE